MQSSLYVNLSQKCYQYSLLRLFLSPQVLEEMSQREDRKSEIVSAKYEDCLKCGNIQVCIFKISISGNINSPNPTITILCPLVLCSIVRAAYWQVCSDSFVIITGPFETQTEGEALIQKCGLKQLASHGTVKLNKNSVAFCSSLKEPSLSLHIVLADSQFSLKNKRGIRVGGR